jgi:hypothetical protein
VERFHKIEYHQLWVIFGINLSKQGKKAEDLLDRSQIVMLAALLL